MTDAVQVAREAVARRMANYESPLSSEFVAHNALLDAYRAALLADVRERVEKLKYDRTVEGYNGFEASVWNGAISTVLDSLDAMARGA